MSNDIIPNFTNRNVTQVPICSDKLANNGGVDVVNCTLDRLTSHASTIFFAVVASLAVILLIWAGIQYIQAMSNPDAVKQARQRIINIIIAVILLVCAWTVVSLLMSLASYAAKLAK